MQYNKPKVLISKCLEFDACRYDGQLITNKYVKDLKKYIDFIPICPEVEIGLGIPRDPIRLIINNNTVSLYQDSTGIDFGDKMKNFSKKFINSIKEIDGIILKSKSPSCAIQTANQYANIGKQQSMSKGAGMFAQYLIDTFPNIPKEEEIRLNNVFLREHFYTSIFVIADFRNVTSFKSLYDFHAKHKLLLMAYNQLKLTKLGNIAANHKQNKLHDILEKYYNLLLEIFKRRPRYVSHINTQMHAFGYYKKQLQRNEKKYFLDTIDKYREKRVPISAVNYILNAWNIRFNNKYLLSQSYFAPYPKGLVKIIGSRLQ